MKKIIHYPILPKWGTCEEILKEMERVSKRFKHPMKKLSYEREIFYFKAKGLKDEGWTDVSQITFTN